MDRVRYVCGVGRVRCGVRRFGGWEDEDVVGVFEVGE